MQPPAERKKYSKTRPIQNEEFDELRKWWNKRKENENAWKAKAKDIIRLTDSGQVIAVNLDIKNPNRKSDIEHRSAEELIKSIKEKEEKVLSSHI